MDKLKPCPFCGGEAEFDCDRTMDIPWSIENAEVRCVDCECKTETFWCDNLNKESCIKAKADASATWNTRVDGWISIDDKPIPLDNFIQCSDGLMVVELSVDKYGDWTLPFNDYMPGDIDELTNNITHWQPLPELPEAE